MQHEQKDLYLIIPMPPTPNGRIHIGHAAGPYLRADTLARNLRREGKRVLIVTGTDTYENWVLLEAQKRCEHPEETCRRNHELIGHDFNNLNIVFDLWFNPLSQKHIEAYSHLHEELLSDIIKQKKAFLVPEAIPYSTKTGEYVIGVWIAGQCPHCDQEVAGNSCVKCGASFQPSEIKNPRSRIDNCNLNWTDKESWFVEPKNPREILDMLEGAGLSNEFIKIAEKHLERAGTRVRVSQPGSWGIKSKLVENDCVITNTYYGFALYCAKIGAELSGYKTSFLEKSSSSTTVIALFGKDNAGVGLVAPCAISLSSSKYRGFDHLIVNHLLNFEGSKCSTSRKHGIWVSELLENTSISGDELRYYLAQASLESEITSLSLIELIESVNLLRSWRVNRLDVAFENASRDLAPNISAKAREAITRQSVELQPEQLRMKPATLVLTSWMFDSTIDLKNSSHARSWLEGFALLAFPIMPSLAVKVWKSLGLEDNPTIQGMGTLSSIKRWKPSLKVKLLSTEEVIPFVHISSEAV
jgi:methionyl-tRNA synthetase